MKKIGLTILILSITLFLGTNVFAAGAGIHQGSSELVFQGSLGYTNASTSGGGGDLNTKAADYQVGYGYFITDAIQLGAFHTGRYQLQSASGQSDNKFSNFGLDLSAKYHFYSKGATLVPYLGLQGGVVNVSIDSGGSSSSSNNFSYGGMGGLKFFFSENFSFNTELNYRRYKNTFSNVDVTNDDFRLFLGFSYYF